MRGGKEVCNGSDCRQRACPLRHACGVPPLPEGEALAGRFTSYWTPEARYGAKGRALLQRAGASGQAHLVKLSLAQTAEHCCFRDIVLRSSRRNLPDMPMAPPLGELANEVRLRGQGCCQTALHCDSIAPTKSLPIAARRLSGDRLALSVTPVACHLSQRERLWHTRRLKNPLSEIAAPRGAGYLIK